MADEVENRGFKARCSFCRKAQDEVAVLIAGPGVAVCNECVALCNGVLAQQDLNKTGAPFDVAAQFRAYDSDRILTLIKSIEGVHQDVSAQQDLLVDILRERDISWSQIGEALDVTRQAAWRRFARAPAE